MKPRLSPVYSSPIVRIFTPVLLFAAWALTASAVWAQTISLIPTGAVWKFLDTGVDPGAAWHGPAFDDTAWSTGPAQLGFGDMDEATLLNSSTPSGRLITAYFRHSFLVPDAGAMSNLTATVLYDDGAVVYLNGTEVARVNMPAEVITYNTLALSVVENALYITSVSPSALVSGTNVLAVEVHQANATSTDLSFDLVLTAAVGPSGPQPPVITQQPVSQTAVVGQTATFSVIAVGTPPLRYQWLFNGSAIVGGTNVMLVLSNVQLTNGGNYSVVVANAVGSVSSDAATLTVMVAPITGATLIATGAVWRYLDTGMDPGTAWRAPGFDDRSWSSGPAQLGFGDGDEATLLNSSTPGGRLITAYFRHSFLVPDVGAISNLTATLLYDDGAVVYVNGVEAFRVGMAPGPVNYNTFATTIVPENALYTASLSPGLLVNDTNLVAVEVHQANATSTDLSFAFELLAAGLPIPPTPPVITQQPASRTVLVGSSLAFSVTATGTPPLAYQWQKDAADLMGATNTALVLANVQTNDSGDYRVRVSNATGSVTSAAATLTVLPLPPGAGWVDLTFNPILHATFTTPLMPVEAIAVQADGKLLVGGSFSNVSDVACSNLVRLDPDGRVDHSFNAALTNFFVGALAVLRDGRILAGGVNYTWASPGSGLVRLHADGTLDTNFQFGLGGIPGGKRVTCLAVQPDGRIVVSTDVSLSGTYFNIVARLNADGSLDPAFGPRTNQYWRGRALVLQPDGKVVVGGQGMVIAQDTLNALPGNPPLPLMRLNRDGSLDTNFVALVNGAVNAVVLQPDGRLVIGGGFSSVNGTPCPRMARLNADGSLDTSFQPNVNDAVAALALQPDGRVLLGGRFTQVNGVPRSGFARLNADGTLDITMHEDVTYAGGIVQVEAITLQSDGQILMGGRFTSVDGVPRTHLARLYGDRSPPTSFVRREIAAGGTIRLIATPTAHVSVYAVEDQPPDGWPVTDISHSGVFDSTTGKVKFGPFYDHAPRTLGYSVIIPPCWPPCPGYFTGTASVDGVNTPIVGDDRIVLPWPHPADRQPPDWSLSISEVTAYGAAWRRGETWPVEPNPVSIDYVTRGGVLWRRGECYEFDPATNAPLWWVPCRTGVPSVAGGQAGSLSYAERRAPLFFIPGEPLTITISASPAVDTSAYAVEDQFPAGSTVANISSGGELDGVNGKVKWGPFLDPTPRIFSYQILPPTDAAGEVSFIGTASFDGLSVPISGASTMRASCCLSIERNSATGGLAVRVHGQAGVHFAVWVSHDLRTWVPLSLMVTNGQPLQYAPWTISTLPQTFYMVRPIP